MFPALAYKLTAVKKKFNLANIPSLVSMDAASALTSPTPAPPAVVASTVVVVAVAAGKFDD
jgi:hypothetical protein